MIGGRNEQINFRNQRDWQKNTLGSDDDIEALPSLIPRKTISPTDYETDSDDDSDSETEDQNHEPQISKISNTD